MTIHTTVPADHRCPTCSAHRHEQCTTVGGRRRMAHRARKQRAKNSRTDPRRYVLMADDARLGLRAGDVLICKPYWLDPEAKAVVLLREADRYSPNATISWGQVTAVARAAGIVHDVDRAVVAVAAWRRA